MISGSPRHALAAPEPAPARTRPAPPNPSRYPALFHDGTQTAIRRGVSDRRPNLRTLHDDESGAAFVEYVVVLLLIGTVASVATFSLGRPFVDYYRFAQLIVSMPFP